MRTPEQFGRMEAYPPAEQAMSAEYKSKDPEKGIANFKTLLSAIETNQER